MKKIMLMPINIFERTEIMLIENQVLSREKIAEFEDKGATFYSIEDFAQDCNDQLIDLDLNWITCISI